MSSGAPEEEVVEPVEIELRDGRHVTVRTIRAEDADKLQDAIRALSKESRYYRFFSPVRQLSPELLQRATHPEAVHELLPQRSRASQHDGKQRQHWLVKTDPCRLTQQ